MTGGRPNGSTATGAGAELGHHPSVAQPHLDAEGPIAEAEADAARSSTTQQPLGPPGSPLDRRSPFLIGFTAALGVAVVVALAYLVVVASDVLVLIGVALFLALGLEPAVSWLARRGLRRGFAVALVCLGFVVVVGGFLALAVPPLIEQAAAFLGQVPRYLQLVQDRSSTVGQLDARFGLQQHFQQALASDGSTLFDGVLGVGTAVLGGLGDTVVVVVLTVYFLATLPGMRRAAYRLAPASRRPRTILIGDAICVRFGGYVLGNVVMSVIAGAVTFVWLLVLGVPYALPLAVLVALLDLIPVVGAVIGGVLTALVALTVSWPTALATVGFFVLYKLVEDYLLMPKIMGRTVEVPALLTVVAVLIGGALLGVVGAVVAIPVAAAVLLIVQEIAVPRLDRT
ncbi:putative PurR-regulated permease PerM [Actinomycetospora corticicola]|uniref:Putative PurR-regulated permease PerM n=1 Tax=Actinomycetospora corticicola TaxID=663602 RepID=A0A7Y9DXS9_9PSEU|nr:AI-2E family transporter [Actinomycetospora corticicola]NYD37425.1 putative PurR-regulated permease PerM [Actinomycetospora corticicola]